MSEGKRNRADTGGEGNRAGYLLAGSLYTRRRDRHSGLHLFFRDGEPISLAEWNRAVNRHQPMSNKLHHPIPLVRYLETRRRRRLVDLASEGGGRLGADVGCERGYVAAAAASGGRRMLAVDVDPEVVAEAAAAFPEISSLSFLCGDAASLPLRTGCLDFCICAETLEHLEDAGAVIAELARVTRTGGRIILSVPNDSVVLGAKSLLRRLGLGKMLGSLSRGQAMGHLRSFSARTLLAALPGNCSPVKVFYDKPFFLNIYLVAEVAGE